jgi:hypothetical protein
LKERYCDDENDPSRVTTSLRVKDWGNHRRQSQQSRMRLEPGLVADLKRGSQRRKWSTIPRAAAPNKAAALHNEPSHFTVWRLLFNALKPTGTEIV